MAQPALKQQLSLTTISNQPFDLPSEVKQHKATVLVFLSPDCPLCQGYTPTISALADTFTTKNIAFWGVFPGTLYSDSDIVAYRDSFPVRYPLLHDPKQLLTNLLGATVTPEVFVLDSAFNVLYSGRIDNWMYDVAKKRVAPTQHDLEMVLREICAGKTVTTKHEKAFGCLIEKT